MLQIPKRRRWGPIYAKAGGAIGIILVFAFVADIGRNVAPKLAHAFHRWPHSYRVKITPRSIASLKTLKPQVIRKGGTPVVPATQTVVHTGNQSPSTPTAGVPSTPAGSVASNFASHNVIATVFWIGEKPSADNSYITNTETEWDSNPVSHFGGYDDPDNRAASGVPAAFTPKHNPFYFALPVSESNASGKLNAQARSLSPWAGETVTGNQSLLKGRWIRVQKDTKVVYCQWVDSGPYEENDYNYVYGSAAPKNSVGEKAGLDLSPTAAKALGVDGSGTVTWRFATAAEAAAAAGLWNNYPAINNINYWD